MTTGSPTCAETAPYCVRAAAVTDGHLASKMPPSADSDADGGMDNNLESTYICSGLAHNYEAFVPPAMPLWNWKETGQVRQHSQPATRCSRLNTPPLQPYFPLLPFYLRMNLPVCGRRCSYSALFLTRCRNTGQQGTRQPQQRQPPCRIANRSVFSVPPPQLQHKPVPSCTLCINVGDDV